MATTTVEFGFGSTWKTLDASITWTDVSAYALVPDRIVVSRGRQNERDDFAAGRCNFTLNNSDRRFDPDHATGPYFGNLKPGVPVRIRSTANAVTSDVFRGFVHGWPQRYDVSNRTATVPITASDGFRMVARADLPASVWMLDASADASYLWWRLNETTGQTVTDSSGNGRDGVLQVTRADNLTSSGLPALAIGDPLIAFESTPTVGQLATTGVTPQETPVQRLIGLPTALPFTFEAWIIHDVSTDIGVGDFLVRFESGGYRIYIQVSATSVGTNTFDINAVWGNASGGRAASVLAVDLSDQPHHIAFVCDTGVSDLYFDGVVGNTAAGSAFTTGKSHLSVGAFGPTSTDQDWWEGRYGDFRFYNTALSAARIAAHYAAGAAPWNGDVSSARVTKILDNIGWPSDLRALSTGDSTLGPTGLGGKALAFLKNIELSEQGRLFISKSGKVTFLNRYWGLTDTHGTTAQVTLSDVGANTPYSDIGYDYDDEQIINKAVGSRAGGGDITISDATSIAAYGEMVDSELSSLQLSTDAWVRSALQYRVDRYKDPVKRLPAIRVPLDRLTAAQQSALLTLELGYRVNVERTPQGVGTALDADAIVEGITHEIATTAGGVGEHWMTFQLSPVDTRLYAIWGTSTWDGTDTRWGF